jgi:hypothetical protein
MFPPIGYHIRLKRLKDGVIVFFLFLIESSFYSGVSIIKPYTVVNQLNNQQNSSSEHTIELLIKHYTDRLMTPILKKLNIGIELNLVFVK